MENQLPYSRALFYILLAFAATAVASIALQNILLGAAILAFVFDRYEAKQKIEWPWGLFPFATLLFLASFFLASAWGIDPGNSLKTVYKYFAILPLFLWGAIPLGIQDIRKLIRTLVLGGAFCALYGIVYRHFILHFDRITSFSGDKMVFGGMLMSCLLLQLWLIKTEPQNKWNWVSAPLLIAALVLTQTRGAWVGFGAGFALLAWRFNKRWLLAGALLMVLSVFLLPQHWKDRLLQAGHFWVAYSASGKPIAANETRVLIWMAGWEMIKDHPWGVGQGNVTELFPKYVAGTPMAQSEPDIPHLHNNFLQVLAQNGWIGLVAYLFWIFTYYGMALRAKSTIPDFQDLNWAFLCVFSAILVWGLTEYTFSHQFMNFQFFLLGLQLCLWKSLEKNNERV
jgi:O-antigen ligase